MYFVYCEFTNSHTEFSVTAHTGRFLEFVTISFVFVQTNVYPCFPLYFRDAGAAVDFDDVSDAPTARATRYAATYPAKLSSVTSRARCRRRRRQRRASFL